MAPSVWGPVFLQQPAAVFDDLAPEFSESEVEDVHEDEMEEEEEGEGDEHGSDGEVVPMDTEDSGEEHEHYYGCGRDMLTLCFPGAVHIFMSASPDKVSQVEAALSLKGRLDPADYTAVPPAERNTLTMTFRDQECEFDSVTPDEVQDILLSFAGRDLMVPRIELKMVFPNGSYDFDSVSPDKLQAVLSLLEGMELTVSAALPCAFKQLTEPLMCWIDVLDPVCPCKVQALHSLLGGNELNPGIEVEFPALVALLMRFREKLENQDFVKICYTAVWKKLALRMQRSRCQFTSSRRKPDKSASELVTPDGSANTGSVESANRGLVEARCLSAAE